MADERLTRRQALGLAAGAAALGAVPAWAAQPGEGDALLVEPQDGPLEVHLPRGCKPVIVYDNGEAPFEVKDVHIGKDGVVTVCVRLQAPLSFVVLDFNQRIVLDRR